MKTILLTTALTVATLASFSQNICPSSFKRNNGNGTCGSAGELRLNFSPVCPTDAPIIDSVYTNGVKSNVTFALPNTSHCGGNNGYLSYCVTSGNMPPANVWTIYFHNSQGWYSCLVEGSGNSTLVVRYSSFDASVSGTTVTCNWVTEEELNNNYFELERSFDGINYSTIAMIFSANNSGSVKQSYKYKDNAAALKGKTVVYYRIKQVDFDGTASYSKMISLKLQTSSVNELQVSPNPFAQNVTVKVNATETGNATIKISNLSGQTVATKQTSVNKGYNDLQVDNLSALATGMYILQVSVNGTFTGNQKLIKN